MINFADKFLKQNPQSMMIRRYALAFLLGICMLGTPLFGQVSMTIATETATAGSTVDVDVTVNDFVDVGLFEFGITYDDAILQFADILNVNGDLDGFDSGAFATPPALSEGSINCNFFNGEIVQNLPDGAVLFTIRYTVVGAECAEGDITFNPGAFFSDETGNNATPIITNDGAVNVDGVDCGGGGGGGDATFNGASVTACPGESVCVPITVMGFSDANGIGSSEGLILWDETVLTFVEVQNVNLPSSYDDVLQAPGQYKYLWFNSSASQYEGLEDGETLFEMCFDVIGDVGESTDIELIDWEWTDNDGTVLPLFTVSNGFVEIVDKPTEQFEIAVADAGIFMDENGCLDITVNNFQDILALEFRITWDASVTTFESVVAGIQNLNSELGITGGQFNYNPPDNFLTFSWTSGSGLGLDVADGTVLFQICFEATGDCDQTGAVQIVPNGGSTIIVGEESNGSSVNLPASQISVTQGSVTVDCIITCEVVQITGACEGVASGSVIASIENGCSCSWANASGTVVSTDCNLLGVEAGTYTNTVTCPDGQGCTLEATVPELSGPTVVIDITNASCGNLGALDVTVSDVAGDFDFVWSNNSDVLDPTGLMPGTYTITVTDETTGCMTERSATITDQILPLTATAVATDAACFGESTGSIFVDADGGCMPFMYAWSGGLSGENPMGVAAGMYTVTVTDAEGTTATASATVAQPASALAQDGTEVIVASSGSNGSISLMATGGTAPYTYSWSNTVEDMTGMLTGLAAGDYSVTITDANGCTIELGPFTVPVDNTSSGPSISVTTNNFNGSGTSCFDSMDAIISVTISAGDLPGTLVLSGTAAESQTVTVFGTQSFTGLGGGDYTITFMDAASEVVTASVTIAAAPQLIIDEDSEIGCETLADGFIDADISGGTGSYTLNWNDDPSLMGASLDGLTAGTYTLMVTDENGCEAMEMFFLQSCIPPGDECYEFPKIITPNGDGVNEFFSANCLLDAPALLTIYDRWGRMIFTQDNYDGSWNGVDSRGTDVIEGGYMYVLQISFPQGRQQVLKGTVTVLRD